MDKKQILSMVFAVAAFFALLSWVGMLFEVITISGYNVGTSSAKISSEYLSHAKTVGIISMFAFSILIAAVVLLFFMKHPVIKYVCVGALGACSVALLVLVAIAKNNIPVLNINSNPPKVEYMDFSYAVGFQGMLVQMLLCGLILGAISIYFALCKKESKPVIAN